MRQIPRYILHRSLFFFMASTMTRWGLNVKAPNCLLSSIAGKERSEAPALWLHSRESPGAASKTHPIFDPIPWFLFNLQGKIPERGEKWIFLIQVTREWQVRAVFSSAQNFLMDSSEETPFREQGHCTYTIISEWIGDGYLQWNVVRLIKMALPVYKTESDKERKMENLADSFLWIFLIEAKFQQIVLFSKYLPDFVLLWFSQ